MTPKERAEAEAAYDQARLGLGDALESLVDALDEYAGNTCGHCGRPITQASRGWAADGTMLCHTGIIPAIAQPMDCYKLVTQQGHDPAGECCRTPTVDWTGAEIPLLALLPWAASLTREQRREMLDEAAGSDDPAAVIRRWKRVADNAWPLKIHVHESRDKPPGYGPGHLSAAYERGRRLADG